jgi:hypothetical protein
VQNPHHLAEGVYQPDDHAEMVVQAGRIEGFHSLTLAALAHRTAPEVWFINPTTTLQWWCKLAGLKGFTA